MVYIISEPQKIYSKYQEMDFQFQIFQNIKICDQKRRISNAKFLVSDTGQSLYKTARATLIPGLHQSYY